MVSEKKIISKLISTQKEEFLRLFEKHRFDIFRSESYLF